MLGTDTGSMPGLHLSAIGDEAAQHMSLFVIYLPRPVNAKCTHLAPGNESSFFPGSRPACLPSFHFRFTPYMICPIGLAGLEGEILRPYRFLSLVKIGGISFRKCTRSAAIEKDHPVRVNLDPGLLLPILSLPGAGS